MSTNHHAPHADSAAPSNRPARRAQRKGKAAPITPTTASLSKRREVRQSQVMAQQRFKGRRGNR